MIRENEVNGVICSEIPSLAIDLSLIDRNKLYKVVNCLTDHTKEMIREHRSSEVMQCFQTAYELLHEGTSLVKLAMVSIYINSVSRLLEGSFCPEQCVKADFLAKFGDEYYKLIYVKNP
jgi:hypothetical protein